MSWGAYSHRWSEKPSFMRDIEHRCDESMGEWEGKLLYTVIFFDMWEYIQVLLSVSRGTSHTTILLAIVILKLVDHPSHFSQNILLLDQKANGHFSTDHLQMSGKLTWIISWLSISAYITISILPGWALCILWEHTLIFSCFWPIKAKNNTAWTNVGYEPTWS